jgi:hypothetical protein
VISYPKAANEPVLSNFISCIDTFIPLKFMQLMVMVKEYSGDRVGNIYQTGNSRMADDGLIK